MNLLSYPIELGSRINASSCVCYVPKDWARALYLPTLFSGYGQKVDLEQVLVFNGKNSYGEIIAKGALKDEAFKVFRGNIFLNSCKRSIGRFADSDILLNIGTSAHSIPTIMCDEDDVIGEHAASFLQLINSDKLYDGQVGE